MNPKFRRLTIYRTVGVGLLALALLAGCEGGGKGSSSTTPTGGTGGLSYMTIHSGGFSPGSQDMDIGVKAVDTNGRGIQGMAITLTTTLGRLDQTTVVTGPDGYAFTKFRVDPGVTGWTTITAAAVGTSITATRELYVYGY